MGTIPPRLWNGGACPCVHPATYAVCPFRLSHGSRCKLAWYTAGSREALRIANRRLCAVVSLPWARRKVIADSYVVRGGTATADLLQKGYGQHRGAPSIYGLSVQYAVGKTLEALSRAGHVVNGQISYATADELAACLQPLGYTVQLIKTPGIGYHHTLCVVYDANGIMLQRLPRDAAAALSAAFHRVPNPALLP